MAGDDKKPKDTIGHAILEQARKSAPFQARKIQPDDAIPEVFGKDKNKNFELNKPDRGWKSYDGRPLDQDRVKRAKLLLQSVGWNDNFTHLKREDVNAIIRDCLSLIWNDEEDRGLYRTHKLVRIDREPKKDAPPPSPVLYRDEPLETLENPFELSPLGGLDEKERLALENIDYKTLAAYVAQLEALDPEFDAELKAARTARQAFGEAAKPSMPLPTVAPKLWADRTAEDPDNASDFIRVIYADWLPNVLARQDLRELDYALYDAYAQRIRPGSKHKDDKVEFAPKRHRRDRLNDEEAGARRHASADAYNAKLKPS
jgi:hypothetical protein